VKKNIYFFRKKKRMRGIIRVDLILSYWLFFWWILYEIGAVEANPKLFLWIGLIVNIGMLVIKICKKSRTTIPFIIVNTLIKVVPLIMLIDTAITYEDVKASLIVLLLFVVWASCHFEKIKGHLENRDVPPFEYWWVNG
jgi:hypothetical protein